MRDILNTDNIFMDKLRFWYGKQLDNKQVSILHTINVGNELYTVIFILKENTRIEIARVFTLGKSVEISVDIQCDTTCVGAIKQLIEYGSNNFKPYELNIELE